ncbi:MAG TPA: carboxypeptidase-like regulatory domain-containing protein [Candidatus Sulfotelmatobacter sp.]|nr:carboxypeptidase-like regulatory domain-containing protein [Candidatus Sulfotelmatobacter sp.]
MSVQFRIASPCSADWNRMPGDNRVRYCAQCHRNVYNFSTLSPKEIERLVLEHEGQLCARYYRRADGSMLAQNCPVAVRDMLRWTTRIAAGVLAAVASVSPTLSKPSPQQPSTSQTHIHSAKKSLSIKFVDPTGAPLLHTQVTLQQISTGHEFQAESSDSGEVIFSDLPKGTYKLTAIEPGFTQFHLDAVKVPYSHQIQVMLELPVVGTVIEIKQPDYQPDALHRFFSAVKRIF